MRPAKHILVVDDNSTNVAIIEEILEGEDYVIHVAGTGQGALRIAERLTPRVVLLDVMLPDIDGLEVCRRIRQMPDMAHARIIMVSAKAMPSEQAAGLDAGADDYIVKPFDDVELIGAIQGRTMAATDSTSRV